MPKTEQLPKYRLHQRSRQAVVDLNGESFYLGRHGSQVSKAKYDRLIAEWLANGRRMPNKIGGEPERLICELIAEYWDHAQVYYARTAGRHQSRRTSAPP